MADIRSVRAAIEADRRDRQQAGIPTDKTITYTRSATASATTQQLSAFQLFEDLILGEKSIPFESSLNSKLTEDPRSQVLFILVIWDRQMATG